jgi:hypothetical protein
VIAVVVILLCCCALMVAAAAWLWTNGDRIIQLQQSIVPMWSIPA